MDKLRMLLLFLHLIFVLATLATGDEENEVVNTRFDFCDETSMWVVPSQLNRAFHPKRWDGDPDVCYLIFFGATMDKLNKKHGETYTFENDEARKICKRYKAALLTIRSFEELLETVKYEMEDARGQPEYRALGATVRRTHNEGDHSYWVVERWDDDLPSQIEHPTDPDFIRNLKSPLVRVDGKATLVSRFHPGGYKYPVSWMVAPYHLGLDGKTTLICKQNLTTMKSNIPPRSPLIEDEGTTIAPSQIVSDVNMCNYDDRHAANIKEGIDGRKGANNVCYFQIMDAEVNTLFQPGYYHFSFKKARGLCRKYGATLLTLRDFDEVRHAQEAHAMSTLEYVALGVSLRRVADDGYFTRWELGKWDDNLPGITSRDLAALGKTVKGIYHPNDSDTLGIYAKLWREDIVTTFVWNVFQESVGVGEKIHFYCKQNLTNLKGGTSKTSSGEKQATGDTGEPKKSTTSGTGEGNTGSGVSQGGGTSSRDPIGINQPGGPSSIAIEGPQCNGWALVGMVVVHLFMGQKKME